MRAEHPDLSEPAGFYVPGAVSWMISTRLTFGRLPAAHPSGCDTDGERIGPHLAEEETQD